MIAVYTCITAEKDKSRNDIKVFPDYEKFKNPVLNAKIYKILSHKFLDEEITIWLDGNIYPLVPIQQLVSEWLGDADMAVFKHNHRFRLHEELSLLKKIFKKRTPWVQDEISVQLEHYKEIGFPMDTMMSMCGMIIRRNKPIVNQFNEAWWAEICRWGQRDQMSFPVVLSQFPTLKVSYISGNIKNHPYLRYETHAQFDT